MPDKSKIEVRGPVFKCTGCGEGPCYFLSGWPHYCACDGTSETENLDMNWKEIKVDEIKIIENIEVK